MPSHNEEDSVEIVKVDEPRQESTHPKPIPLNLSRDFNVSSNEATPASVVPIGAEQTAQGLLAVGGCRQCARTFTDRLELIHHFVDHFPGIFYCFEPRKTSAGNLFDTPSNTLLQNFQELIRNFPIPSISESTPLRLSKSPPSLPISADRDSNITSAHATATATPIVINSPVFSALPIPNEVRPIAIPTQKHKSSSEKQLEGKKFYEPMVLAKPITTRSFGRLTTDLPYHMCPYCCQTFLDAASYEDHMFNTSSDGTSAGSSANKCNYCDMQFSNVFLLTEHQKLHAQICNICNRMFMTVFDLNLHMGTHTGFSYDCKDCGHCFPSRKALAEHNKTHRIVSNDSPVESRPESKDPASIEASAISPKKIKTEKPLLDEKPESLFLSNPYFAKLMSNSPRKRRAHFHYGQSVEENHETPQARIKRHRGTKPEPRTLELDLTKQEMRDKQSEFSVELELTEKSPNENAKEAPDDEKDPQASTPSGNLWEQLLKLHSNTQAELFSMLLQQQNR